MKSISYRGASLIAGEGAVMEVIDLVPGDLVLYVDPDQIQWGPWEILRVQSHTIVVSIEDGFMEQTIPSHCLQ